MKSQTEVFRRTLSWQTQLIDIDVSPAQLDSFCAHYELLLKWNDRIRLTGAIEPARAAIELFADSLIAYKFIETLHRRGTGGQPPRLVDIGSGSGFPAVPLKIMRPEWHVTLIDSSAKKVSFLKTLVQRLALNNIEIFRGRAEHLAQTEEHREMCDIAFCRAVTALQAATELAFPFLKVNGSFIGQTTVTQEDNGRGPTDDFNRFLTKSINASIEKTNTYTLPGITNRRLLLQIKKTGLTS